MKLDFLKLDINILDDMKIKRIRKHPGGNDFFILWIWLLCTAMKSETPGYIYITDGIPYRLDDIADEVDLPFKTVEEGLKLFIEYRMVEMVQGGIIEIINFQKHQRLDKIEKARITSRETSRRYRERQKRSLFGDTSLTKSQNSGDETELDTDIEKELDLELEPDKDNPPEPEETFFRGIKTSFLKQIHETWLSYDNLIKNKWGTFTPKVKGGVREQLLRYQHCPGELLEAIKNYSGIIASKQHYWTKRWPLWEFLSRGVEKFLNESEPWDAYKDQSASSGGKVSKRAGTLQEAQLKKILEEKERKSRDTVCCEVCGEEKLISEGTFDGEGIFYCGCKIIPEKEGKYI